MQFLIVATDDTDPDAPARRVRTRPAHAEGIAKLKAEGRFRMGGHTLDANERIMGSAMVVEFASREECDAWVAAEPYVVQKVWREFSVVRINLG
jgi:uncharacterized protein YciI